MLHWRPESPLKDVTMPTLRLGLTTLLTLLISWQPLTAWSQIVSIGVLNQRGEPAYTEFWDNTAKYLSKQIPEHSFIIKPLGVECLTHAISKQQLDFIITDPAHFITLKKDWGAFALASLESRYERKIKNFYSATVITQAHRTDLNSLADLKKSHFMASSPQTFGSFLMLWRELKLIGINPHADLFELYLSNHNDLQIIQATLNNEVDAAVIQSGMLEHFAEAGLLQRSQIKVLNPSNPAADGAPIHSTQLYPEWQFIAVKSSDVALSSQIAKHLKNMPKNVSNLFYTPAYGWALPNDMSLVHSLLLSLNLPPYDLKNHINLRNLLEEHWITFSFALTLLIFLVGFSLRMRQVNRQLATSKDQLAQHRDNLTQEVAHQTLELQELNQTLEQDISARQKIENTLRRSQRALQGFYQILINSQLNDHQKLIQLMQLARHHFQMESVFLYQIDKPFSTTQAAQLSISAFDGDMALNDTILNCLQSSFFTPSQSEIQSFTSPSCDKKLMSVQILVNDQLKCILAFGGRSQTVPVLEEVDQEILKLLTQWIRSNIEHQEIAQERENYRQQLGKAARLYSVAEMASGLAHEINQPLTAATNYVSGSLLRLKEAGNGSSTCNTIEQGLNRSLECLNQTSNIIRRLREFVQTGAPCLALFDFPQLAHNVLDLVQTEAKQKNITLTLNAPTKPQLIQGDQVQLEQVLLNLVRNAVDASNPGDEVQVVMSQTPHQTLIEVKDTGKGIDPKELPKIFDLFHTSKPFGMGLGLAICRSIIEAHDSRLQVKNTAPGAVFSFTLNTAQPNLENQES